MPSTYTSNLLVEKIGTGEQAGQWGNTTNLNFDILDEAINGTVAVNITSAQTSGSPNILLIDEGALSDGRNFSIELTGSPGGNAFIRLDPNTSEKIGYIKNSFGDSSSAIIFQGTYDAARDYVLAASYGAFLKFDGVGSGATVTNLLQNHVVDGTLLAGNVTVGSGGTLDATGATVDVSGGTLTLANNQISGDKIDGGSISNFASTGIDDNASSTALTIDASGNITVSGTVDGRDIAADGTKLDGIAPGAQVNVGTNLSATADGTQLQVNSSTGNNVDLPAATTSAWGVMTDEDKTKLDGIAPSANNYSLPKATATVRGGVELGSDTVQTVAANTPSATAGKTYAVQLNSADQMVVNVPWSDTTNPGTVTSVAASSGTGISVTGSPITTSGTLTITNTAPDTGVPALLGTGGNVTLNTGITQAEVRTAIGAGTGNGTLTAESDTLATVTGRGASTSTECTFNGVVNFRSAVDLADNDILRFGSSDDCELFFNGTNMYIDLNLGDLIIRDGTTTRFTFDDTGDFTATGDVTAFSDERLKENIETLDGSKVYEMRGVSFTKEGKNGSGVIAQELQKVAPELVHEGEEYLSVAYGNLVGYLIEAVKELKAEIEELKGAK